MTRMEGMWNASRAKLSTHASMMVSSDGPLALERTVFSKSREDFDFDEDLQDREFVADFDFDNQIRIKSIIIDVTLRSSSLGHSPVRAPRRAPFVLDFVCLLRESRAAAAR